MTNQVFEFVDISIAYKATGGSGTFELYTDTPGSSMTLRSTISLPATVGQQTKPTTFSPIFYGTTYRPKFTAPPAGTLAVVSATMHVNKIGLYLQNGEVWEHHNVAIAV